MVCNRARSCQPPCNLAGWGSSGSPADLLHLCRPCTFRRDTAAVAWQMLFSARKKNLMTKLERRHNALILKQTFGAHGAGIRRQLADLRRVMAGWARDCDSECSIRAEMASWARQCIEQPFKRTVVSLGARRRHNRLRFCANMAGGAQLRPHGAAGVAVCADWAI